MPQPLDCDLAAAFGRGKFTSLADVTPMAGVAASTQTRIESKVVSRMGVSPWSVLRRAVLYLTAVTDGTMAAYFGDRR